MLVIGTIDNVHGLKGDVVVKLLSNVPERLELGSELFIQRDSSQKTPEKIPDEKVLEKITVKSSRKHKKKFVVKFEGIETRELAEELRSLTLFGHPLSSDSSDDNLWLHEIVGCEVFDQNGKSHGKVSGLEINPASDLLVLESGALVPAVFIESYTPNDSEDSASPSGVIKIHAPSGLLD